MHQTSEQLKQRARELLKSPQNDNDCVNVFNQVGWKLLAVDAPLALKLTSQALKLARRNQYLRGEAYAQRNLGWSNILIDQPEEAERSLKKSQHILDESNDQFGLASIHNALALCRKSRGQYQHSLESFFTALDLRRQLKDDISAAGVLNNLGAVYLTFGDYALALDCFYQALSTVGSRNHPLLRAQIYGNLGGVLWRVNESSQGLDLLNQALENLRQHTDIRAESVVLVNTGSAHHSRSEYHKALEYYERGLELARNVKAPAVEAEANLQIGITYSQIEQEQTARSHISRALELAISIKNLLFQGDALLHLGLLDKRIGDVSTSLENLHQALDLGEALNARELCYKANLALSDIYENQNQMSAALAHYREFHRLWNELHGTQATNQTQRLLLKNEFKRANVKTNLSFNQIAIATDSVRSRQAKLSARKLKEVSEFITDNLDRNIIISDLSKIAGVGYDHFIRSFKESIGKTPHQYLIAERVERSKWFLQKTSLPLVEIALRCGFGNQSHFAAHFRSFTGVTPLQFRRSS